MDIPKDYVPMPDNNHLMYQVEVPVFAGPLDLLLFLIRRHAVDIFDIPISFICDRYTEYLNQMEDLNIDIAAEFMLMTAELLFIKSKMLLPKPEVPKEEEPDPRAQLVERLLMHQLFKDAAVKLEDLDKLDDHVFARKPETLPQREGQVPMQEVGVYALVKAFSAVLKRQKPEVRHQVLLETVSLAHRMRDMVQHLATAQKLTIVELLSSYANERLEIIISFLSLLEMTRLKLLRLYQQDESMLYIQAAFSSMEEALNKLDAFNTDDYAG